MTSVRVCMKLQVNQPYNRFIMLGPIYNKREIWLIYMKVPIPVVRISFIPMRCVVQPAKPNCLVGNNIIRTCQHSALVIISMGDQ